MSKQDDIKMYEWINLKIRFNVQINSVEEFALLYHILLWLVSIKDTTMLFVAII